MASEPRIAVVLPGGGTRGAYEAGALSVLLPVLPSRGERIDIVCGTSVGAINAALLARSPIACALIAPERRGMLGELAEEVFRERYGGLRGLPAPDFPLLARLLGGGRAPARGELLSFLLFDEVFVEELLAAGRRDAERWLERHLQVWCADAGHDTGFDLPTAPAAIEAAVLDEYRALRRR